MATWPREIGGLMFDVRRGRVFIDGVPLAKWRRSSKVRPARRVHQPLLSHDARAGTIQEIELTPLAVADLKRDALEEDGCEVGGPLLGRFVGDRAVIEAAYVMLNYDGRSADGFTIDPDHYRQFERSDGRRWVGDRHTHRGDSSASDTDLNGWTQTAANEGRAYVGVIVNLDHDRDGWPWVTGMRGWITSDGKTVPTVITT
jgi:hypothetical protein